MLLNDSLFFSTIRSIFYSDKKQSLYTVDIRSGVSLGMSGCLVKFCEICEIFEKYFKNLKKIYHKYEK